MIHFNTVKLLHATLGRYVLEHLKGVNKIQVQAAVEQAQISASDILYFKIEIANEEYKFGFKIPESRGSLPPLQCILKWYPKKKDWDMMWSKP